MTANIKRLFVYFVLLFVVQSAYSQLGFSHEVGIIAGPVAFKSDFGVRSDHETNSGNTGFGVGLVHYINFSYRSDCNCYTSNNYFNDHFKLRSEISWNRTKLNHYGKWVRPERVGDNADRLRAHSGEAQNWDIGMQLEYFPRSIRAFSAGMHSFAPFFSFGAHYVTYNPGVETTYGDMDIENPDNFYSEWDPGSVTDQSGSVWSLVGSVGSRYKLTMLSDLMVDLRFQYFFSDWIDGLNHQLPSNKRNDWLVWLNFGYIYYLD